MQNSAPMPVKGRVPYEAMIELCNTMDTDFWVTVPHMATDEYVANLAHLIHTGVDRATGEKTTEPLEDGLKVWIEYSNAGVELVFQAEQVGPGQPAGREARR